MTELLNMLSGHGELILEKLREVAAVRARWQSDPALSVRIGAVKSYQHRRFEHTYADLLADPRYAASARFFLDDLYGPRDFTDRDAQFARVVPGLVRLFPAQVVATVADLAVLHALSESLDLRMAEVLSTDEVDALGYLRAWQAVGCRDERVRQVGLMSAIGDALEQYTRSAVLWRLLVAMRLPARAAGLAALQGFLERGFDTFRKMRGAAQFLGMVREREMHLIDRLFAHPPDGPEPLPGELP